MNSKKPQGFSLLELLTTLACLGVLLSLGTPSLSNMQQSYALKSFSSDLVHFIRFTRHQALAEGKRTTMCPLDKSQNCNGVWTNEISVFEDNNGNRKLDPAEKLMKVLPIPKQVEVNWRGMGKGKSLHFNGRGLTSISNGTFRIGLRKSPQIRHVVISRLGKVKNLEATQRTK